MKLREFYKALSDLEKIIEIDPDNITAHTQKGLIHAVMKEYSKALESYDKGLSLDPNNTQCKDGFRNVVKALNFEIDCTNEERIMRKLVDPQIRNILSDPQLIEYLETVELNPSQSADPGVQENYNKLIDAGIKKAGTSS